MFRRAITLTIRTGSGLDKMLCGQAQPVLERDRRLPAERARRGAHVGPGMADVAGAPREVLRPHLPAEDRPGRLRQLVHRHRAAGGDVEYGTAGILYLRREQVGLD